MSTTATTEEPPKAEPLPPVGNAPTPEEKNAFLNIFRKTPVKVEDVVKETPKEEIKKEEAKKEEVKKEAPKEEKKSEPVKEEPVKTEKAENFATLRQQKEAAEKAFKEAAEERDRLRKEYEELSKKPAPEEFLKRLEATEKEKAEYQKRLREADLSRDPEFNAKYDNAIRGAMAEMVNIAAASGVDRKEATAAVSAWNEGQFTEWLSGMSEIDKLKFGANLQRAVSLYQEKEAELANAETTYQSLQKQREEQQKNQHEQRLSGLAADVEANLKDLGETPLGKDHTDLLTETRTLLRRAARLEGEPIEPKVLLGMVGKSLLLAKGFERQEQALAEKAAKIEELEKTLAERDAFIKEQNGSTPPVNGLLTAKKDDKKAAARAILNPVIA